MPKKGKELSTDMTIEQDLPIIDPDQYNSIVRCAKLLSVQLVESHFSISPSYFKSQDEGHLGLEFNDLDGSFNERNSVATAMFLFESCKKLGRKKVISIKDTFAVFYQIDTACDEDHAVAFARKVGLMAAYPYFRAHAAHLSSLANADMPILPSISSMPIKGKVKKEPSDD